MTLSFPGVSVTIGDDDPRAVKIRQGFAYSFENGELIISNNKTNLDREDLEDKLTRGIASTREIQTVLLHLLKKAQTQ